MYSMYIMYLTSGSIFDLVSITFILRITLVVFFVSKDDFSSGFESGLPNKQPIGVYCLIQKHRNQTITFHTYS